MGKNVSKESQYKDLIDGAVTTDPAGIKFLVYSHPEQPMKEISSDDFSAFRDLSFDASRKLVVIIHGMVATPFDEYPQNITNAYLRRHINDSKNIILVDWSKLGLPESVGWNHLLYPAVIENVQTVGERMGQLIGLLKQELQLNLSNVHVIGHSLGCHVAGWVGYEVRRLTGMQLGRITALDPGGPLFYFAVDTRRLNREDAKFLDVYHMNALLLGKTLSVGHVDFFINRLVEPNGTIESAGSWIHARIHRIFTKTILDGPENANNGVKFIPSPSRLGNLEGLTERDIIFGEHCPSTARGRYFVDLTYT